MIVLATALIVVPLGFTSYRVLTNDLLEREASSALSTWLTGTGYRVISVSADDDTVDAEIAGDGTVPPMAALLTDLKNEGANATIEVHVLPEQTLTGSTTP